MKPQVPHHITRSIGITIILLAIAVGVRAQYVVSAKAGVIQFATGDVFLNDKVLHLSKGDYIQVENGQSVRTERGFAELLLGADVYLRLGKNGLLRMDRNQLNDTQLTLERGSALVEVVEKAKGSQLRIKFAAGLVEFRKKGLYRLDSGSGELRVYGGEARVAKKNRKAKIKSGKMIRLDNDLKPLKFDANEVDLLHQWAAVRSFTLFNGSPSARTQRHWTHISMGWLRNYDYRMRFRSEEYLDEWRRSWRSGRGTTTAATLERARRAAEARAAQQASAARLERAKNAAQGTQ